MFLHSGLGHPARRDRRCHGVASKGAKERPASPFVTRASGFLLSKCISVTTWGPMVSTTVSSVCYSKFPIKNAGFSTPSLTAVTLSTTGHTTDACRGVGAGLFPAVSKERADCSRAGKAATGSWS